VGVGDQQFNMDINSRNPLRRVVGCVPVVRRYAITDMLCQSEACGASSVTVLYDSLGAESTNANLKLSTNFE
jgi:hypothetical protein